MSGNPLDNRYDQMQYRRCGQSGLYLPAISLGLWHNFGAVDVYETSRDIVLSAFDHGITHFDLANNYGPPPGSAEETLGRILRSDLSAYREELVLSTKAGFRMWPGPYGDWGSRKYLIASVDASLKRLGSDRVDIFYSHRYDPDTPLEETMGALDSIVRSGKALYAGISNYPPEQTRKAAILLREMGTPCLVHQAKYSMLFRNIEHGLTDVLTEQGMGCTVFSPLAQGLLTDRYFQGIPKDSRAAKSHGFLATDQITESRLQGLQKLQEMAERRNQSLAQMALAWILRLPVITSVLVGVSRRTQLEQNIATLKHLTFEDSELVEIDRILNEITD